MFGGIVDSEKITNFVIIKYVMEANKTMTVQKLAKTSEDPIALAQRYYGLISSLNNLQLTEREIQLIAFSAFKGSVSLATVKKAFCDRYNSSFATVNNMVSKLRKQGIFTKDKHNNMVVSPILVLDFSKPIVLQITLTIPSNVNLSTTQAPAVTVISNPPNIVLNGKASNNALEGVSYKEAKS